jgi:hypothetical protein
MCKCNLKDHPDAIKVRQSELNQSKGKQNGERGYEVIPKWIKDNLTRIESISDMRGRSSFKNKCATPLMKSHQI